MYTKEQIGSILKQLRLTSGKTQKEVAEIIGRKQQIIGHWETGYSQPDADSLFTLCKVYGTTVDTAFGFSNNPDTPLFTANEQAHIKKYRSLDERGQETVDTVLDAEFARAEKNLEKIKVPLYKVARSDNHAPPEYIEDGGDILSKLKKAPKVTSSDDL